MRLRETVLPYVVQEVDYAALRQAIEQAFEEEHGSDVVRDVRVAHFNPNIIDVTVAVHTRRPEMDDTALALSEELRRQGLQVAIRVVREDSKHGQRMGGREGAKGAAKGQITNEPCGAGVDRRQSTDDS